MTVQMFRKDIGDKHVQINACISDVGHDEAYFQKTVLVLWFNELTCDSTRFSQWNIPQFFFKLLFNELVNQYVSSSMSFKIVKKTAISEIVKLYRSVLKLIFN